MPAIHTDSTTFKAEAEDSKGVVLVDFFATWCGPCQMSAPIVDKMADEYAGKAKVLKVDVDQDRESAMKYGVMSIPTFVVLKDGQEVDRQVGYPGEDGLKAMVARHLAS